MAYFSYHEAKHIRDGLEAWCKALSDALNAYPKGPMGLTLDRAKDGRWRALRTDYAAAFHKLRGVNAYIAKHYAKEVRAERDAKRQARLDATS